MLGSYCLHLNSGLRLFFLLRFLAKEQCTLGSYCFSINSFLNHIKLGVFPLCNVLFFVKL